MILPPYICESGPNIIGEISVDSPTTQEPEHCKELDNNEDDCEGKLTEHRKRAPQSLWSKEERLNWRLFINGAEDHSQKSDHQERLYGARESVSIPIADSMNCLIYKGKVSLPDAVVTGRLLREEEVDLPDDFNSRKHHNPQTSIEFAYRGIAR